MRVYVLTDDETQRPMTTTVNFTFLASEDEIFDFLGIADPDSKLATAAILTGFGKCSTDLVDPESSRKRVRKAEREIEHALVALSNLLEEYDVRVGFMPFGQVVLFAKSDDPEVKPIKSVEEFREIKEEKAILALTPGMTLHLAFYIFNELGDEDDDEEEEEEE